MNVANQVSSSYPANVFAESGRVSMRLGMPHLDGSGLSLNWLLRECCHTHWWAIARQIGTIPSELHDRTGARILPSIVALSIRGTPHRFEEDECCDLAMTLEPSVETGWRSLSTVDGTTGASIEVELVSAFAKRDGTSNKALRPAVLDAGLEVDREAPGARRAQVLRARGAAERKACGAASHGPILSAQVHGSSHFNGVGLMYFANFNDAFERAEHLAMPEAADRFRLIGREITYFSNIDEGDWLDIETHVTFAGYEPDAVARMVSVARRRSDDKTISVAISVRRDVKTG